MVETCVLAVEDTLTMRALISDALDPIAGIEFAGHVTGADEARAEIERLSSELMTLSNQMQGIGGVDLPLYAAPVEPVSSTDGSRCSDISGLGDGNHMALSAVIARELVRAADELYDLGCTLASDDAILVRHIDGLQALDRLSQTQRALAKLMCSGDPLPSRLDRITLAPLAARLRDQLGPESFPA